jgi:hypothetical protein
MISNGDGTCPSGAIMPPILERIAGGLQLLEADCA